MSSLPARVLVNRSISAAHYTLHVQLRPLFSTRKIHHSVPRFPAPKISLIPPPTALSALAARLSLTPSEAIRDSLTTCLTHPSYFKATEGEGELEVFAEDGTPTPVRDTNELLSTLGNSFLGLFAAEHLSALYPYLPTVALQNAVTAYVGPIACFSVGRLLGVAVQGGGDAGIPGTGLGPNSSGVPVRWSRSALLEKEWADRQAGLASAFKVPVGRRFKRHMEPDSEDGASSSRSRETHEDVVASSVRAFVGLIYQEQGIHAARTFVHAHFLSRALDLSTIVKPINPMQVLSSVVLAHLTAAGVPTSSSHNMIQPRLLASTGVASQAPLFLVGLFLPSGIKLAEGHGSTKSMAKHRAATNALYSIFFTRGDQDGAKILGIPGLGQTIGESGEGLPSSAHETRLMQQGRVLVGEEEKSYVGVQWGGKEVISGSRR